MDEPMKKAPVKDAPVTPAPAMQGKGALVASGLVAAVLAVLIGWSVRGAIVAFVNLGNGGAGYNGSFASGTQGLPANVTCSPKTATTSTGPGGATVTLTGSGGGATAYTWYAPGATIFSGTGTTFSPNYTVAGVYKVVLVGDRRTDACTVTVVSEMTPPPPTPTPVSGIPVTWTTVVGATATGNNLKGTGATGSWGASGAVSAQALASGDGAVQVIASETTTYRMFGLSNGNANQTYTDIDFGMYPALNGALYVYEAGTNRGTFGTYATGDVLKVAVAGGKVVYSRNGTVFYTSTVVPKYPLLVDTAFYSVNSTINGATLTGSWK